MYKLFIILFIILLSVLFNVFACITETYGYTKVLTKLVEKYRLELAKIKLEVNFLIKCKIKSLILGFAKPTLIKITNTWTETKLKNKYKENKRMTEEIKDNEGILYSKIGFISKIVVVTNYAKN